MDIKSFLKNEKGDILVLFSFLLIVLILLAGLVIDYGITKVQHNKLNTALKLINDSSYEASVIFFNSDNPKKDLENIVYRVADLNGINRSNIKEIKWIENLPPVSNPDGEYLDVEKRVARTNIVIEDKQASIFGKIAGIDRYNLRVEGGINLEFQEPNSGKIWFPPKR